MNLLHILGGDVFIDAFDRVGDHLQTRPFYAVTRCVLLGTKPAYHIDREAFLNCIQRGDTLDSLPGCDVVPSRLDDRLPVPAFVGEVCRYGEMRHPRLPDLENVDIADIPSDFKSVQLFHNSSCFEVFVCRKVMEVSGAKDEVQRKLDEIFQFLIDFSVFAGVLPRFLKSWSVVKKLFCGIKKLFAAIKIFLCPGAVIKNEKYHLDFLCDPFKCHL